MTDPLPASSISAHLRDNFKRLDENWVGANIEFLTADDWTLISQRIPLSEAFMHAHRENIDWKKAFKYQYFTDEFIERRLFKGRAIWKSILTNKKLDEALIEKYWLAGKMPWKFKSDQNWAIFSARAFSRDFILRHPERLTTFMYTQKLWQEYIEQNYWLIVANCRRASSSYGSDALYEDWDAFRKKQKHLPDSFFAKFPYRSVEDAYPHLTELIVKTYGEDKIDWLEASIHTPPDPWLVSGYRHLLPNFPTP